MKNRRAGLVISILFLGLVLGTAKTTLAETSTSVSTSQSSPSVQTSNPSSVQVQTTVNTSSGTTSIPSSTSPGSVEDAINKANSGQIFDIKAIPPGDALVFLKGKLSQFYLFMKELSYPYETVVILFAGMIIIFPFKPRLKKYMGWSILGGGALGFLFIHFGPVLVGIFRGLTQQ